MRGHPGFGTSLRGGHLDFTNSHGGGAQSLPNTNYNKNKNKERLKLAHRIQFKKIIM